MEQKQETKSLPRNRKCGNCRYFEPAPLWRKGWCRNPRLYDRRANHLVDASSIDCEQVFRARIYWEPIPTPDESNRLVSPFNVNNPTINIGIDNGVADGGRGGNRNQDNVLRPNNGKPQINRTPAATAPAAVVEPGQEIMTTREKAAAAPNVVKKDSQVRKWLLDNMPYYDRLDGILKQVRWKTVLPWLVIGLLAVVILVNLSGGKEAKNSAAATPTAQSTAATSNNAGTGLLGTLSSPLPGTAVSPTATGKPAGSADNKAPQPTATLSNAVPTQVPAPTPTIAVTTQVKAKVTGTGTAKALNMRSDTSTKDDKNIISKIPEGTVVDVVGGPKLAENKEWWQISYQGKTGWASKEFLQEVKP